MKKRAQVITFEFLLTLVAFILFISVALSILIFHFPQTPKNELEVEYVFANLENNLAQKPEYLQVLHNFRANKTSVEDFWNENYDLSIDGYALETVGDSLGIGLDNETYDVCLYYTDIDGEKLKINGNISLGLLKNSITCQQKFIEENNPCDDYKQAISVFQPILWDEGDPNNNRIIQMNLVLCKV